MRIQFTESRHLLRGGTVAAGAELDLPEADARAFIANGVAVAVDDSTLVPSAPRLEPTD